MLSNFHYWVSLKKINGWSTGILFLEKVTSTACLLGSGLKDIRQLFAQLLIISKSLINISSGFIRVVNNCISETSSAKSLTLQIKLSVTSFMYTKKSRGPQY